MIIPRHSGYSPCGIRLYRIPGLFGSDAPDNSGLNAAALQQAKLSGEQLDFVKQIYGDSAPDRADASQRARATSDMQMQAAQKQMALTDDYSNYQKNTFRPLEQGIVADAQGYDTPERREAEAAKSAATVEQSLTTQQGISSRNMERSGALPGSGKALALQNQFNLGAAGMQAAAQNNSRTQVETIGAARKADAANLGRNLASNQATSAGIALNQGNSAVANGQVPLNVAQGGVSMMNSGFSGAQQGLSGAANTYGTIGGINNQAANANNGLFGALGTAVGGYAGSTAGSNLLTTGLMALSDVTKKEDITPMDPAQALASVEDTPVSNWAYKQGVIPGENGDKHTGPMAQDVQRTMGDKVAPKGKKIDLVSMNGITMAAVQGLSQKVDRLMASRGIPA